MVITMNNLIRGEFYKLRKSKYFIGMIILSVIFGLLLIVLWNNDREGSSRQQIILNGAYALTEGFDKILLGNFLFGLLGSGVIIKDFKSSNISKSFIYGYKRNEVVLSKIFVIMLFSLILEIIYIFILVTYVSLRHNFCGVWNLDIFLTVVRVIIIGVIYNLATISIIFMTAIITKSNFATIVAPFILSISFVFAFPMSRYGISYILSHLPYITGMSAMGKFSSKAEITRCIISSIVTFIITIGGSLLYVKHEDIK